MDLTQEDGPRQEELKGFDDPKVFLKIVLDERKSRVLLNTNVSLVNADDEEQSFKWCERWLGDGREQFYLVFEIGESLEDRMSGDELTAGSKID